MVRLFSFYFLSIKHLESPCTNNMVDKTWDNRICSTLFKFIEPNTKIYSKDTLFNLRYRFAWNDLKIFEFSIVQRVLKILFRDWLIIYDHNCRFGMQVERWGWSNCFFWFFQTKCLFWFFIAASLECKLKVEDSLIVFSSLVMFFSIEMSFWYVIVWYN